MAKAKISAADYAEAHKQFTDFLKSELPAKGLGKVFSRFKGDGPFGRRLSKRMYAKFLDGGGKAGDWASFWKYLMENLPAILALLMKLFV